MNLNMLSKKNALLELARLSASPTGSHKLSIEFHSQPELIVPLTSVVHLRSDPTGPHDPTAPVPALLVEATPTPYGHWGINE